VKVLDLFSGIGGFSLGFHRAGLKTKAFCEIDKHCYKVLRKNFPTTEIFSDIKDFRSVEGEFDVICGGFPCQDISVAGKQKGLKDELGKETRSGLWFQFKRLIEEIKPKYVVIENVRNLLSNGLATVLKDLSEIGYDAEWEIISARDVGACHLRERIWIIAYPKCERSQRRILIERESGSMGSEQNSGSTDNSMCEETSSTYITNSDDFRFWPTFATEEEKSQWWTEATASFRDWWQTESTICRVDDGLPRGLDKGRAQRIKQLGNSIVPAIAEIIGRRIMYHEHR
jgi:DNA (cytosine-5)-methyltransferase 1